MTTYEREMKDLEFRRAFTPLHKRILANILFWMGDRVCRIATRYDNVFLFTVYQRLMIWSDRLKPWTKVEE